MSEETKTKKLFKPTSFFAIASELMWLLAHIPEYVEERLDDMDAVLLDELSRLNDMTEDKPITVLSAVRVQVDVVKKRLYELYGVAEESDVKFFFQNGVSPYGLIVEADDFVCTARFPGPTIHSQSSIKFGNRNKFEVGDGVYLSKSGMAFKLAKSNFCPTGLVEPNKPIPA